MEKFQSQDPGGTSYFCEFSIRFWVKKTLLKYFDADPDPGSFQPVLRIRIRDWRKSASGSGMNNPDYIF
jgi:hypothetical protein